MEQYISKSALVAEINKRIIDAPINSIGNQRVWAYNDVKDILNNLEVKEVPIWEKVSPDTGQTTLYKDGGKSYLERFGYRIDLKELDKLPKKNLKEQKGE